MELRWANINELVRDGSSKCISHKLVECEDHDGSDYELEQYDQLLANYINMVPNPSPTIASKLIDLSALGYNRATSALAAKNLSITSRRV